MDAAKLSCLLTLRVYEKYKHYEKITVRKTGNTKFTLCVLELEKQCLKWLFHVNFHFAAYVVMVACAFARLSSVSFLLRLSQAMQEAIESMFEGVDGTLFILKRSSTQNNTATFICKSIGKGMPNSDDAQVAAHHENTARQTLLTGEPFSNDGIISIPVKVSTLRSMLFIALQLGTKFRCPGCAEQGYGEHTVFGIINTASMSHSASGIWTRTSGHPYSGLRSYF